MKRNVTNLQPWLDYFDLLRSYELNGYLEILPDKGEAYITQAAFFTLTGYDDDADLVNNNTDDAIRRLRTCTTLLRRLRAYAGWRSQEGKGYLKKPFAMNVVSDNRNNDPLFTMLLTRRRKWWALWRKVDDIEVIQYDTRHVKP